SRRVELCSHDPRAAGTLAPPDPDAQTCAHAGPARLPRSRRLLGPARIGAAPPGVHSSAVPSPAAAAAISVLSPPVSPAGFRRYAPCPLGGPAAASLALREGPLAGAPRGDETTHGITGEIDRSIGWNCPRRTMFPIRSDSKRQRSRRQRELRGR